MSTRFCDSEAAHTAKLEQERRRDEAERLAKERELEQAKALAEAQRQRADEQAAASIRQRRFSWALVALLALAVGAGFYGWQQKGAVEERRQAAEHQGRLASSRQLRALLTQPQLRTFLRHQDGVHSVAFSPDGNTLASRAWTRP